MWSSFCDGNDQSESENGLEPGTILVQGAFAIPSAHLLTGFPGSLLLAVVAAGKVRSNQGSAYHRFHRLRSGRTMSKAVHFAFGLCHCSNFSSSKQMVLVSPVPKSNSARMTILSRSSYDSSL